MPALKVHELWRFSHGHVTVAHREEIRDEYWVADRFVDAIRRGDRTAARQFTASDQIIDDAIAAQMARPVKFWGVSIEGDTNGPALQLGHNDPDGAYYAASFHFERIHNQVRIRQIVNYRPK
jgi:hypothetical protein